MKKNDITKGHIGKGLLIFLLPLLASILMIGFFIVFLMEWQLELM